jgi:hypothetical protein
MMRIVAAIALILLGFAAMIAWETPDYTAHHTWQGE